MLQPFFRLAVFSPLFQKTRLIVLAQILSLRDAVQIILRIFRESDFAGKVGTYNAVAEISRGAETFVPTKASSPTQGEVNVPSNVVTAQLVTYLPATTTREELGAS